MHNFDLAILQSSTLVYELDDSTNFDRLMSCKINSELRGNPYLS